MHTRPPFGARTAARMFIDARRTARTFTDARRAARTFIDARRTARTFIDARRAARAFVDARRAARWLSVALSIGLAACGSDDRRPAPDEPRRERAEPAMRAIAGSVTWDAQDPLVYRAPANSMRAAEYGVRGHDDATLAVFFFGGQQGGGGDVQSNIDRWLGQLEQPDGRPTAAIAHRAEREVNGMRVTTVDARGTFVGRIGMGGGGARPGWRVLGAIVEGPEGLVFFKLTGPEAAVDAAELAFERLVGSLEPM